MKNNKIQTKKQQKLTPREKLILLELPIKRAVAQLRIFVDNDSFNISDEGQCSISNLASWLEGVMNEDERYMPWRSKEAMDAFSLTDNYK